MNNRYTLPITAAVAVHASLMFGFRHPASPIASPDRPTILISPPFVPNPDRPDPSDDVKEAAGSPNPDAARGPEPLVPSAEKAPITVSVPPVRNAPTTAIAFDSQPFGIPGGDPREAAGPIGVITVAGLDNPPRARVQSPPVYPFAAKHEGLDGEVIVEFLVDETGSVSSPTVVRSTNPVFDEPSLRAVLKWRFEPGRREGRVVRFRMSVPVVFHLNNG